MQAAGELKLGGKTAFNRQTSDEVVKHKLLIRNLETTISSPKSYFGG